MLTRNRGKFKSIVEFLGLKKKPKKATTKAKTSVKSKNSSKPRNNKVYSTKVKHAVNRKKLLHSKMGSIANCDEEKLFKAGECLEPKTGESRTPKNCSPQTKTLFNHFSEAQTESVNFQSSVKSNVTFKLCDSVLQEILQEISYAGRAFRTQRKCLAVQMAGAPLNRQTEHTEVQYRFMNQIQQKLFTSITASLDDINQESDKKDAFLGSYCLLRPGLRKLLRIRRKIRENISRSACTRRLRPNPRKRRFSDMISSDMETTKRPTSLTGSDRNVSLIAKKLADLPAGFQRLSQPGQSRSSAVIGRGCPKATVRAKLRRSVNGYLDWKFHRGSKLKSNERESSPRKYANTKKTRAGESSSSEDGDFGKEVPVTKPRSLKEKDETNDGSKETVNKLNRHHQLNPWDRVVLGLTCSLVSSDTDGEILVKQLRSSDLSILLQRISGSAFKIKGLSTNKNANDEQEFNVTLSYKPKLLASIANPGKKTTVKEDLNSLGEEKTDLRLDDFSDKATVKGVKKQQLKRCELSSSPNFSLAHNDGIANRERTSARHNRGVIRQPHPLQVLGLQHLRARAATPVAPGSSPDRFEGNIEEAGATKSGITISPLFIPPPSRRNVYRRVVRKVYTGTSMVPKILNRHRLSTSVNFNTRSVSPASQILLSQYSHAQKVPPASLSMNIACRDENAQEPQVHIAETATSPSRNEVGSHENNVEKRASDKSGSAPTTGECEVTTEKLYPSCKEQNCCSCAQANPAGSVCASQLLRLKRQQDGTQKPVNTTPITTSVTKTSLLSSGIDAVSQSISIPSISLVQSQQSQRKLNPVQSGNVTFCSSAPTASVDVKVKSDVPTFNHLSPPTALIPLLVTVLVPSISRPLSTIAKPQTSLISTPSSLHLQAYCPNVVPTAKPIGTTVANIANLPVISPPNAVGFLQTDRLLPLLPIIKTGIPNDFSGTSSNRGRRTVVHKCHIFRKISPKRLIPLSATPTNTVSTIASKPGLLKSLLECNDRVAEDDRILSLSTVAATPIPLKGSSSATALVTSVSHPPVMSTGVRSDQACHSRGTWQVGGRAIVLDVALKKSSVSTPTALPISQQGTVPQAVLEESIES